MRNPTFEELKILVKNMPNAVQTVWGNFNVNTRVKSRSSEATYIVGDSSLSGVAISRDVYRSFAENQDHYLAKNGFIQIDGSIGNSPKVKAQASLIIEKSHPNIAAMQKQLFFNPSSNFIPQLKVIYSPNFPALNFPHHRCILVDLENYTTRIAGTDYFGESKKAGLRMWNKWVFDLGGLALHAGCKAYTDTNGNPGAILVIGLSGTGKTTTTFTSHLNSSPIQDDFCAFFPGGKIYASENGCFAKTFGLNPKDQPAIYQGITNSNAYLENTFVEKNGKVNFLNDEYTSNGRGTFQLDFISHGNVHAIPPLRKIFILNRNFDIIPAIAKLNKEQAAAFFMLGETTGTSAGGKSEAGKKLRIPGTNPFFPLNNSLQGNRFLSLLDSSGDVEVYLLNTGWIGGIGKNNMSRKVTIEHSKKIIESLLRDEIKWKTDNDFKYQIVDNFTNPIDEIFINPKLLYRKSGRASNYEKIKSKLIFERKEFLSTFKNLSERITKAL